MNIFDQMRQAVSEARSTLRAVDSVSDDLASMLRGRLRHVQPSLLVALKRELQDFDAHRKEWKK